MEATLATAAPTQRDFRAELHELIDQIQDAEMLRVVWKLLAPQVATVATGDELEAPLSPAWRQQLSAAVSELDAGKGVPAAEVFARLLPSVAA